MNKQPFLLKQFSNGLTLIGEPMPAVRSVAYSFLLPVGAATDPDGLEGSSSVLSELVFRGAGNLDAQALSDAFENLGCEHSHSAGTEVTVFSGALLGDNLKKALELQSLVLRTPTLSKEALEPVRELALQDLNSLEDEPSSKVMVELSKLFFPSPFNRSRYGSKQGLESLSEKSLRDYFSVKYQPKGAVLSVAGAFDWNEVVETVERLFSDWSGVHDANEAGVFHTEHRYEHLMRDTNQMQIALAYPSGSYDDDSYYPLRVGLGVLSGGMFGRLFVEVREKRGLVYNVSASHHATKGRAAVFASASTTPANAEETLSVMLSELRSVENGVTEEELARAKANISTRLVMQGESSSGRAATLVTDWWNLGRVRTLEEITKSITEVTSKDIIEAFTKFKPDPLTVVTLGSKKLEKPFS